MFFTAVKGACSYRVAVLGKSVIIGADTFDDGHYRVFSAWKGGTKLVEVGSFTVKNGKIGPFNDPEEKEDQASWREMLNDFLEKTSTLVHEALATENGNLPELKQQVCVRASKCIEELRENVIANLIEAFFAPADAREQLGYDDFNEVTADILRAEKLIEMWDATFA